MARYVQGFLSLFLLVLVSAAAQSQCPASCGLALASYYMWKGANLSFVNERLQSPLMALGNLDPILRYNKQITNKDSVLEGTRILVPFPCDCLPGGFLGHVFPYQVVPNDSYSKIAITYYSNLTTVDSMERSNKYPARFIPINPVLNVTVNCSCGDPSISKHYGLFITYPFRSGEKLFSIANKFGVPPDLIQKYNPGVDLNHAGGFLYLPAKDPDGKFPRFKSSEAGPGAPVIAGICVGSAAVVFLAAFAVHRIHPWKKLKKIKKSTNQSVEESNAAKGHSRSDRESAIQIANRSIEFSYEELAKATDNFNMSNKIGEGGFGTVYYAELRGEKAAIKKMEMQASKQFLAELKVLTSVHHINLVHLIGYCKKGSLFLVYEYVDNGTLGQHLRGSGRDTLPWSKRVQIALDSARGLEYLHERTVPTYIHRDVKSANILIDKNYRAKVADFGLTKLVEVENTSAARTGAVGTFGYMPPECVNGDFSAKVDVYAFGVVLYELISAKPAIVKLEDGEIQFTGLVSLFNEVFNEPDTKEALRKIIDPRLGESYGFDSIYEMAELARSCTQEKPQQRPQMKHIVVALMTLSSTTGSWNAAYLEDEDLIQLSSSR